MIEQTLLWKLTVIWEGARRQGSPSTCMGMGFRLVIRTDEHWVTRSPLPPICNAAYNTQLQPIALIPEPDSDIPEFANTRLEVSATRRSLQYVFFLPTPVFVFTRLDFSVPVQCKSNSRCTCTVLFLENLIAVSWLTQLIGNRIIWELPYVLRKEKCYNHQTGCSESEDFELSIATRRFLEACLSLAAPGHSPSCIVGYVVHQNTVKLKFLHFPCHVHTVTLKTYS